MHYACQCGSYNKWCDHNSAAAIRKPHCLTGSHTQFHAEDFLSDIYVSRRNRPRRFGRTNHLFWKQIKHGGIYKQSFCRYFESLYMSIFTEKLGRSYCSTADHACHIVKMHFVHVSLQFLLQSRQFEYNVMVKN